MLNYELGMGQLICAQNEKRKVQNMNKEGKAHLSDILEHAKMSFMSSWFLKTGRFELDLMKNLEKYA